MARKKAKALPQPEPEMFTIYGDILQQTEPTEEHEGAILINCGDAKEVWLSVSVIQFDGERGDTGVAITIPDWLAEQEGLHDGQGKAASQPDTEGTEVLPAGTAAEVEAPAPQPCRFKAEVTGIVDDTYTILVIAGNESREFTFAKDALRFDGDDVVDLQVGYTGIEFLLAWPLAVESGLADFLGPLALPAMPDEDVSPQPVTAPEQEEPAPVAAEAATEAADDDAPKTKPYKQRLRSETIKAYVELTLEEKVAYAQDQSDAMERRMDHKETAANYSRLSREADKEAYKIKAILDAGREEREIDCDVVGDFNTGELVYVESEWPHREIQRRPMTDKDRQLLLPIEQPKEVEPEAAAAQPAEAVEATAEPEETETVTLYGVRNFDEDTGNDIYFEVHYGDEEDTIVEFFIPKGYILSEGEDSSYPEGERGEHRYIEMAVAHAVELGIIDEPENAEDKATAPVDETSAPIAPGTEGMNPDALAEAEAEKGCSACAHRDETDDESCDDCGDDLTNFAPVLAMEPQSQAATAGSAQ